MFTGIVERCARVAALESGVGVRRLWISREPEAGDPRPWDDLVIGESIAVNGCCLTLVAAAADRIGFDVIEETLRRSSLGDLGEGSLVNLERSLRVGDRFGGHYVMGHIDAVGSITSLDSRAGETILDVAVEQGEEFRVIPKGSVTVDGISLTVVDVHPGRFTIALIPHTIAVTHLKERRAGDRVNLETDAFGRWVAHLMKESGGDSTLPL